MLPSHLYESLPYGYLAIGAVGAPATDYSHAGLIFSAMLIAIAGLIIRMRHTYRRQARQRPRRHG